MRTHIRVLLQMILIWAITLIVLIIMCEKAPAQSLAQSTLVLTQYDIQYYNAELMAIERRLDTCNCSVVITTSSDNEYRLRQMWLDAYTVYDIFEQYYISYGIIIKIRGTHFKYFQK